MDREAWGLQSTGLHSPRGCKETRLKRLSTAQTGPGARESDAVVRSLCTIPRSPWRVNRRRRRSPRRRPSGFPPPLPALPDACPEPPASLARPSPFPSPTSALLAGFSCDSAPPSCIWEKGGVNEAGALGAARAFFWGWKSWPGAGGGVGRLVGEIADATLGTLIGGGSFLFSISVELCP